jgi:hypothetical protein
MFHLSMLSYTLLSCRLPLCGCYGAQLARELWLKQLNPGHMSQYNQFGWSTVLAQFFQVSVVWPTKKKIPVHPNSWVTNRKLEPTRYQSICFFPLPVKKTAQVGMCWERRANVKALAKRSHDPRKKKYRLPQACMGITCQSKHPEQNLVV